MRTTLLKNYEYYHMIACEFGQLNEMDYSISFFFSLNLSDSIDQCQSGSAETSKSICVKHFMPSTPILTPIIFLFKCIMKYFCRNMLTTNISACNMMLFHKFAFFSHCHLHMFICNFNSFTFKARFSFRCCNYFHFELK